MSILDDDLARLNLEDILFIIFIVGISLNIYANNLQKDYIKTGNKNSEEKANNIYLFVLYLTIIIYFYFFIRNYNAYKKSSNNKKKLFIIKLFGSIFLICGAICLIYFQSNDNDFIGSPSI